MVDNINWLEPWDSLCVEPSYFEKELYKEVGRQHILHGKKVKAIGKRYDCEEVLFQVHNSEFCYVVVHLTYCSKEDEHSNYPRTKIYKNLDDWIDKCMVPDHSEYMLGEKD